VALVRDGDVVMFGGFGGAGFPFALRDALAKQPRRGLTTVANNTDFGALADAGSLSRVVCSFPTGPSSASVVRGIEDGEIELVLTPQGTLAERIRAEGHGLGGVLTPTGVGTFVQEGKRTIEIDGKLFLLDLPLRADFALINAWRADHIGNLTYALTARNFNPLMAMAADTVIAEARELVPVGVVAPDEVMTPAVLVDHLVARERSHG
jgi:acetate CoA/acetoacetate CoA-transferase alpha subunit